MINNEEFNSIIPKRGKISLPSQLLNYLGDRPVILRKEFSTESIAIFSEESWYQLMQKINECTNRFNLEHNRLIRELVNLSGRCEVTKRNTLRIPGKVLAGLSSPPKVFRLEHSKDLVHDFPNLTIVEFEYYCLVPVSEE